jgi:hypothetical protein
MARVSPLDTRSSRPSLAIGEGDRSLLNVARRQRMLRELGCFSVPHGDSYLTAPTAPDHRKTYEELEAQLQVERALCAEAISRAEAMKKAWEEAETKLRIEIELRVQAERKARGEAEPRLEIEHSAREEAGHSAEKTFDTAGLAHTAITTHRANGFSGINPVLAQVLDEMMARVHTEQQEIIEKRSRAAAEESTKNETIELVSQKRGVLHKVLLHSLSFHSRNRLPH